MRKESTALKFSFGNVESDSAVEAVDGVADLDGVAVQVNVTTDHITYAEPWKLKVKINTNPLSI